MDVTTTHLLPRDITEKPEQKQMHRTRSPSPAASGSWDSAGQGEPQPSGASKGGGYRLGWKAQGLTYHCSSKFPFLRMDASL